MTRFDEKANGVYAEFRDKYCSYVFHRVYDSSNQMKEDMVYRFVKSLEQNKEIAMRFLYAGNVKVSAPGASVQSNFEIEVIPTAIDI